MSKCETRSFDLTVDEIEALIRWHIDDNESNNQDSIDDLYDAFLELGGKWIDFEVTPEGEEALEADADEGDVEALFDELDDRLEAVEEAVERDFEDQYPSHWSMLFDHGNSIDELFKRVTRIERLARARK